MIASRVLLVALLSGFATALPHRVRDSAIDEPAVSAPNGTPITQGTQPMQTPTDNGSSDGSSMSSDMSSSMSSDMGSSMSSIMDSGSSMDSSSSMDSMSTSTSVVMEASSTTAAWNSYQTPTYGSGSSNWGSWGGSNYNDCVSQCLAQYGNSPQPWTPPPTQTTPDSGSVGTGATHTVIVAPSQGVLRYIPFALNASVGDTVKFMWGADTHTVTRSSSLTPCNKTSDSPFTSGVQVKDFVFSQMVNDTNPVFFYCGVPGHCQKGMFGIINPPSASGAGTSVSLMMSNWTSSNPDLAAYSAITSNMTQNNTAAARWGGNIDVASLPSWSHPMVAENVMYTRSFLASNPETMSDDGSVNLGSSTGTPLMIPQDVGAAFSNADAGAGAGSSSVSSSSPAISATSASTGTTASTSTAATSNVPNGAVTTSPKIVIALVAAAASFLML